MGAPLSARLDFRPVLPDKEGMIGKAHDHPQLEHFGDRVFHNAAGMFVDDPEYLWNGPGHGIGQAPARQFFRYGIHKGDPALGIGGNDRIADAGQGRGITLLALPQRLLGFFTVGDIPPGDDASHDFTGRVSDGRGIA